MSDERCEHMDAVQAVKAAASHACVECAKTGSPWVHLRTCQTCGVVLCSDSSP